MNWVDYLQEAIKVAARSWLQVGFGDPNTIDVYWHAKEVSRLLELKLPTKLPEKEKGVTLVECVEKLFIGGSLIRQLTPQSLAERGIELVRNIQERELLSFKPHECYITSLYTWHGCLNMAKLLRKTYVIPTGEAPYTIEDRWQGYNFLRECWRAEDDKGNPWVRYGVSLARLIVEKRGNPIVEDWVPVDSPYWDT